jgi:hypothetical protein
VAAALRGSCVSLGDVQCLMDDVAANTWEEVAVLAGHKARDWTTWWELGQHENENQWDLYTPSEKVRGEGNGKQRTRGKANPCN